MKTKLGMLLTIGLFVLKILSGLTVLLLGSAIILLNKVLALGVSLVAEPSRRLGKT